jgi:predicted enzyme related to lactoylglutathione lyase
VTLGESTVRALADVSCASMRFIHHHLRTLDVAAARAFYSAVLGRDDADVIQLHEQAVARGARPHWLGYLEVDAVDAAATTFTARGAVPFGPKWVNPQGLEAAVVRDPGGAIVALVKPPPAWPERVMGSRPEVAWHELNTVDVERAMGDYGALVGWEFKAPLVLEGLGVLHPFAWQPGGAAIGSMSDIGGRPGVHPHWLFHFRVASFALAVEAVRAGGGSIVSTVLLPGGGRVAVCDDPQGAAFALRDG